MKSLRPLLLLALLLTLGSACSDEETAGAGAGNGGPGGGSPGGDGGGGTGAGGHGGEAPRPCATALQCFPGESCEGGFCVGGGAGGSGQGGSGQGGSGQGGSGQGGSGQGGSGTGGAGGSGTGGAGGSGTGGAGGSGTGGTGGSGTGGAGGAVAESCVPGQDLDGDGLAGCADPDCYGVPGCPDPTRLDVDFDCDGLADGEESSFGTDPGNADSDRDGLPDGLEVGRTIPLGGCALFFADQDPGTTTDPANPDSDADGLPDGVEDLDHDGRLDAGEADPADPDSDADGLLDGVEDADGNGRYTPGERDLLDPDTDNDGLLDGVEDADHDGFLDARETDPLWFDSDHDGLPDGCEDRNGNGRVDVGEADPRSTDTDGDGLADGDEDADRDCTLDPGETDPADSDSDCDGVTDPAELSHTWAGGALTDPRNPDTDGDGLLDGLEAGALGTQPGSNCANAPSDADDTTTTDPTLADTDGDGRSDGCEDLGHDGLWVPGELNPRSLDTDGDGLTDAQEDANGDCVLSPGETNGGLFDTDGDGLSDPTEVAHGTNPLDPDSDHDGLPDGLEDQNQNGIVDPFETNPLLADMDGDGLLDGVEDQNHNGTVDPGETDPRRFDTDGDGASDAAELLAGTDPLVADMDGDGLLDGLELLLGTSPTNPDTDGDTLSDLVEVSAGTNPLDPLDPDPQVRSGVDAVCSPQNLRVVQFRNEPDPDFTVALESTWAYAPFTVGGATAGAAFDDLGNGAAGFAANVAPPVAGVDVFAETQALLARLTAGAATLGASAVTIRNNGRTVQSHDGFSTVVQVNVSITAAPVLDPSTLRNRVIAVLDNRAIGQFGGLPAAGGAATANYTLKLLVQLRTGAQPRLLLSGALAPTAIHDDPLRPTRFELDDLSNGSTLAKAWAGEDLGCDPFPVTSLPAADFLWMADVSASTDNDRGNIATASGTIFTALQNNGVDFRMGVVPHHENDIAQGAGNGGDLRSGFTRVQATFIADLNNTAGNNGCEFGLTAIDNAITKALPRTAVGAAESATKLRPGVKLVVFYISDEHAQEIERRSQCAAVLPATAQNDGTRTIPNAAQQAVIDGIVAPFITHIANEDGIAFGQIIPLQAPFCADAEDGRGYYEVIASTGGTFYRTCDVDPGAVLTDIINAVSGAASQFILTDTPISSTLKVGLTRQGQANTVIVPRSSVEGFDYDPAANTIYFHGATFRPNLGDVVTVSYRIFTPAVPPVVCAAPLVRNAQTNTCECPTDCGLAAGCGAGELCDRDPAVCACECAPLCGGLCGGNTTCNQASCSCECAADCGGACAAPFACDMGSCGCVCPDTTPGDGVPDCGGTCTGLQFCNTESCACACPVNCGGCQPGFTCDATACACVPNQG